MASAIPWIVAGVVVAAQLASNAWGADTPENIAPVFSRFVARARGE